MQCDAIFWWSLWIIFRVNADDVRLTQLHFYRHFVTIQLNESNLILFASPGIFATHIWSSLWKQPQNQPHMHKKYNIDWMERCIIIPFRFWSHIVSDSNLIQFLQGFEQKTHRVFFVALILYNIIITKRRGFFFSAV